MNTLDKVITALAKTNIDAKRYSTYSGGDGHTTYTRIYLGPETALCCPEELNKWLVKVMPDDVRPGAFIPGYLTKKHIHWPIARFYEVIAKKAIEQEEYVAFNVLEPTPRLSGRDYNSKKRIVEEVTDDFTIVVYPNVQLATEVLIQNSSYRHDENHPYTFSMPLDKWEEMRKSFGCSKKLISRSSFELGEGRGKVTVR